MRDIQVQIKNVQLQGFGRTSHEVHVQRFCVDCEIVLPIETPLTGNLEEDVNAAREVAMDFLTRAMQIVEAAIPIFEYRYSHP